MGHARQVFDEIPQPDLFLYNTIVKGYVKNELYIEVLALFNRMRSVDLMPNVFTFPMVLKSCTKVRALRDGEKVHCFVYKAGFKANPFVGTTLIDLYSNGGIIASAYRVFCEMGIRNVVAWTSIINGYISSRYVSSARALFDLAPERDIVLWNSMVIGYIENGDMGGAKELFDDMPNKDLMSWNTLLHGYANNRDVEGCEILFEKMPERNIFSWNGLIGGYARDERYSEVLSTFNRMLKKSNVIPNDATLVTVLSACAKLGALELGKWVHTYSERIGYKENLFVNNCVIDMYAKCGCLHDAIDKFDDMGRKDLISWNTIINALAVHGHGADALKMFSQMKKSKEKPDSITFIGILCACSYLGLVQEGFSNFQQMIDEYSIKPRIEHYGCMVDLLARAGLLDQAMDFVENMPIEADSIIWSTLLGACRSYKNIELAEIALKRLVELQPQNPSNYVTVSNIYGGASRWDDVARLKAAMRDTGHKKLPGCSYIEVDNGVVEFYCLDERHPMKDEIYEALMGLTEQLRIALYVEDTVEVENEDYTLKN